MANVDRPHGLFCMGVDANTGAPVRYEDFTKDASEATAIFIGDAVNREADGNIEAASATPGTTLYEGVSQSYGAAATLTKHRVCVTPSALYEAQDNADTDGFAEADMGGNVNLELNAGNATTKISGHELDESTLNASADRDMKLLRLLEEPGNAYGANGRFLVMFNRHRRYSYNAGVV